MPQARRSPEEIEALFSGNVEIAPSAKITVEQRYIATGRTPSGRAVFVAFTLRARLGRTLIRPLSARYMHRKEVETYEKKRSQF
jgi:uncharacterized protein